jgi:hypothetical protein
MVMLGVVPTLLAVGVPESSPVLLLKLAQVGAPVTENVTVPLLVDTLGWNVYWLPTATVFPGTPDSLIVGVAVVEDEELALEVAVELPLTGSPSPQAASASVTATQNTQADELASCLNEGNFCLIFRMLKLESAGFVPANVVNWTQGYIIARQSLTVGSWPAVTSIQAKGAAAR